LNARTKGILSPMAASTRLGNVATPSARRTTVVAAVRVTRILYWCVVVCVYVCITYVGVAQVTPCTAWGSEQGSVERAAFGCSSFGLLCVAVIMAFLATTPARRRRNKARSVLFLLHYFRAT